MYTDSLLARFNMIQQQVRPWDVLDDRVLEVMAELEREPFVPDAYRGLAYADIEVPLGNGQQMLAPKVVGRLLQALTIRPEDKCMEVGTGSGYASACLSRLGARVVSVEIDPELAARARERLQGMDVGRIDVIEADALAGSSPGAPFDVIAVTGSTPTEAPLTVLEAQLAIGGRMFCIVGEEPLMEALLITRIGARELRRQTLFETCAPVLLNVPEPEGFVF